jgi:hypothetical protein
MGTEVHADRRTRRRRTRSQEEAAALDEEEVLLTAWILDEAGHEQPFDDEEYEQVRAPRRKSVR